MNDKENDLQPFDAKLDEWDAQINKWKTQAKLADAEKQQRYQDNLHQMVTQRNLAQQKLTELRKAKGKQRQSLREGMDRAWKEIETAFEAALARFR